MFEQEDSRLTDFHRERWSAGSSCLGVQKTVCYHFDSGAVSLSFCLGKSPPEEYFCDERIVQIQSAECWGGGVGG